MKPLDPFYWSNLRAKSLKEHPLKRTAIKNKQVAIRKVSKKQAKKLRVYEKEKAVFFETVEHCEFPGCEVVNVTLHHQKGRCGDYLTDRNYFKALCWVHHQWCEENPLEAKAMGLSADRL